MDDQFLRDLKKQPAPEFAARLRATLRALPPNAVARVAPAADFKRWFAAAASIAVVGFAFTLPAVQAARRGVSRSVPRQAIHGRAVRPGAAPKLGVERLRARKRSSAPSSRSRRRRSRSRTRRRPTPARPRAFACARRLGSRRAISSTGFMASSEHAARITVNTAGLQALLDTLGLADVELPARSRRSNRDRARPADRDADVRERTLDRTGVTVVHVIQARKPRRLVPGRARSLEARVRGLASARHVARRGLPHVGDDRLAHDVDRAGAVEGRSPIVPSTWPATRAS